MKAAPTVLCEQAKVILLLSKLLMDLLGPLLAMRTVVLATLSESVAVQILVVQSANDLCGVLRRDNYYIGKTYQNKDSTAVLIGYS